MRPHFAVLIFTLACAMTTRTGDAIEFGDRDADMWQYEEWTLENASWSGNPFDVTAEVTFGHAATGQRRRTQMFYAGNDQWKFRFTGTRTGMWTFSTSSGDAELDGHTGTVIVGPRGDSELKGFLTHVGNKYAIMVDDADDLEGYGGCNGCRIRTQQELSGERRTGARRYPAGTLAAVTWANPVCQA